MWGKPEGRGAGGFEKANGSRGSTRIAGVLRQVLAQFVRQVVWYGTAIVRINVKSILS